MKALKWTGLAVLIIVVVAGGGVTGMAQTRWDRTFEAPYPAIAASTDPDVIAYGKYLVYGPMHCAYCHTTKASREAVDAGEIIPLSGGYSITIPPGTFYAPNLTPDPETGIGGRTDGELARILRHGVRHDGRAAVPFMEFQDTSDDDLIAVISYLRSQAPVRNAVPDHRITFLGKALLATVIKPVGPNGSPPAHAPEQAPTVERGEYVAITLAQCAACHTERSLRDGSYLGTPFAGGMVFPIEGNEEVVAVSSNLTPDPETGIMAGWSEDRFVERFQSGVGVKDSPMPWGPFARMHEDDLRAVYRYLQTLEPVRNETGPPMQPAR
jgi:mono/diheme cytochrome c family protein